MKGSFVIVLPIPMGSSIFSCCSRYLREARMERMDTVCGVEFGTSIPIVPRPGMGAMIRTPSLLRLIAMSSSIVLIRETLIPDSGMTS